MTTTDNNRANGVYGKVTGWALRKFPGRLFEASLIPHRVSNDDEAYTGKATTAPGSETLIHTATAGTGKAMFAACKDSTAKGIRAADLLGQGKEIPRGRIGEEYTEAADAAWAAILKEEGLTEEAYIALLDAFIMAANPPGPRTLHSVLLNPKASAFVFVRVSFTDDENMSNFLEAFPDSVLESGAGTDEEKTVESAYADFLKVSRAAKMEKDLARIKAQKEKAERRIESLTQKERAIKAS